MKTHPAVALASTIDASASLIVSAARQLAVSSIKPPGIIAQASMDVVTEIYSKTSPERDLTTMASCAAVPEMPFMGTRAVQMGHRTAVMNTEGTAILDMVVLILPEAPVSVIHSRAPGMGRRIAMVIGMLTSDMTTAPVVTQPPSDTQTGLLPTIVILIP